MKDGDVLDFGGIYTHLDDMLASPYQSIDWTQHTTRDRKPATQVGSEITPLQRYWAQIPLVFMHW